MIRRRRITDDDATDGNVTASQLTANIAESLPGYFQQPPRPVLELDRPR